MPAFATGGSTRTLSGAFCRINIDSDVARRRLSIDSDRRVPWSASFSENHDDELLAFYPVHEKRNLAWNSVEAGLGLDVQLGFDSRHGSLQKRPGP